MEYPAYDKYQSSKLSWLGDVPADWEIRRLKFSVDLVNDKHDAKDADLEYMGLEHIDSWTGKRIEVEQTQSDGIGSKFAIGDVLFGKLRPYLAKVYLAEHEGLATTEALVMRSCSGVNSNYLKYYLLSSDFINIVDSSTYGAKMPRANWEFIGNLPFLLPDRKEQQKIATFLDYKTQQIDQLIEKKIALIEKLNEQRIAVITQAVTKGLDKNAKMKPSGVGWLGDVPEHWDAAPLKYFCVLLRDGTHLPPPRVNSGVPLLSVRNIVNGVFQYRNDDSNISEESYEELCKSFVPKEGDVLLAIVGATIGKVAIVGEMEKFYIQRSLAIFRTVEEELDNFYLSYIFRSSLFQDLLWENVGYSAQPGIYLSTLKNFDIPIPPIEEQREILNDVKCKLDRFDKMIGLVMSAVQRLEEYRSAIITNTVTGKIDVRNVEIGEAA